jgi:hypothetical protein
MSHPFPALAGTRAGTDATSTSARARASVRRASRVAGEYAAVVGNLATRRPVVVDLAAAKLGYDPRDLLKRVVARSRFLILDASTFLDRVEALGVFRRRPMPAWAPAASPEAFAALLPTLPAADRWGAEPPTPAPGPRALSFVPAGDGEWLDLRARAGAAFGRKSVRRGERLRAVREAAGLYEAALSALRRSRRPAADPPLANLGPADRRRAAAATLLGNRAACAAEAGDDVAAALDCLGALAWYDACGAGAAVADRRGRVADRFDRCATRLGASAGWPRATAVAPTTAARDGFAPRLLRCFLAQDYPGGLDLVVVGEAAGSPWAALAAAHDAVTYVVAPAGSTLGAKRNLAVARAAGTVVLHFDDDDVYAPFYARIAVWPLAAGLGFAVSKRSAWAAFDATTGLALCGNQIFNPTSMCAELNGLSRTLRLGFENSTRAIDPSKNQPNRPRFDRAREFSSLVRTTQTSG